MKDCPTFKQGLRISSTDSMLISKLSYHSHIGVKRNGMKVGF